MKSSDASADQNADRHYQGYATGSKRISSIVPVWVEGTVGEAVDNLSGRMANRTGTIRRKAGLRDPTRHSKCSVPGYCAKQNKSYEMRGFWRWEKNYWLTGSQLRGNCDAQKWNRSSPPGLSAHLLWSGRRQRLLL